MEMDEESRNIELQKIFSQIPIFQGTKIDGPALDFLNKHWRVWIDLGWALKKDVRDFSGEPLVKRAEKEIRDNNLDGSKILPSSWNICLIEDNTLTNSDTVKGYRKYYRDYRKRKKQ